MNPALTPSSLVPASKSDGTPTGREPRALAVPGEFVGPYRLIFELASGGMASVYVALSYRRAGAHRIVAVKRLHIHLADDANYRKMFHDEARIASQIRHPNVCEVFDYGEHDGTPYIVMEYIAGEPASSIWGALDRGRSKEYRWRRTVVAARIIADACEALHAVHELRSLGGAPLNVVHRDVSPENLLVTYDGVVKLCDFGISIADEQEHSTEIGMLKGKYAYIQPEVLRGERPDRRSDIFSLGVVLWELMTGERLFRRGSALETIRAVGEALVPAPSAVIGIASELDAVVLRALSSNPSDRFASAREFGAALNAAVASSGHHAGLGDVADFMNELFPGGREKKEQTIELVASLYEPSLGNAGSNAELCREDWAEAATVALRASSATLRPVTGPASTVRGVGVGSVAFPRPEQAIPRWRHPLMTFVLGAVLAAEVFSPSKRPEREDVSGRSAMPRGVLAARLKPPAAAGQLDSLALSTRRLSRSETEPVLDSRLSCDTMLSAADTSGAWDGGDLMTGTLSAGAIRELAQARSDRRRDQPKTQAPTRLAGAFDASATRPSGRSLSSNAIPPVRSLELGPDFAYAPMMLLPLVLRATDQRAADETSRDPIPFRPNNAPRGIGRFSVARGGSELGSH